MGNVKKKTKISMENAMRLFLFFLFYKSLFIYSLLVSNECFWTIFRLDCKEKIGGVKWLNDKLINISFVLARKYIDLTK